VSSRLRSRPGTKAVVTGGAGFIGSHLVQRLVADGAEVTVIDDLSTGRRENLAGVSVAIAERDLARDAVTDLLGEVDVVFHLAAVPSVPRSVREPMRSHEAAATGTLRLLDAAREAGVRTFVNSSSSSVYGDVASPPMRESMPTVPRSPYAVAKLAAEGYTRVFAQLHGMRTVSLRYFNVFGPRQPADSAYAAVIASFARRLLTGEAPLIYGDGKQTRDFTGVANAVLATLQAGAAERPLAGEVINIGTGTRTSLLELARLMAEACSAPGIRPEFAPARAGDVPHSQADWSRARELIGYSPVATLEQGLEETIAYYRREMAASGRG